MRDLPGQGRSKDVPTNDDEEREILTAIAALLQAPSSEPGLQDSEYMWDE